jgi:hypothetical protein
MNGIERNNLSGGTLLQVARFDRGSFQGKTSRTKEGYLRTDAAVTRTGVFAYRLSDGSMRRELRHPLEVFAQDSLASLKMVPVTNDHPPVRLLTADTAKQYQVGFTGETVLPNAGFVTSTMTVTDAAAISSVDKGKRELSCGYSCDLVKEDGTFEGEPYDFRQTNIRYNHVAIVGRGRAGADVCINLDSLSDGDGFEIENADNNNSQRGTRMVKIVIDGIDYEAAPEVANALTKANKATADAQVKADAALVGIEKIKADRDTLKAKVDAADEEAKTLPAKIAVAVKDRLDLERTASAILPKDTKLDGLSDKEIRTAVIKAKFPKADNLDTASDIYLQARFDAAVELVETPPSSAAEQRKTSAAHDKNDSHADCDSGSSRDKMIKRMKGEKV